MWDHIQVNSRLRTGCGKNRWDSESRHKAGGAATLDTRVTYAGSGCSKLFFWTQKWKANCNARHQKDWAKFTIPWSHGVLPPLDICILRWPVFFHVIQCVRLIWHHRSIKANSYAKNYVFLFLWFFLFVFFNHFSCMTLQWLDLKVLKNFNKRFNWLMQTANILFSLLGECRSGALWQHYTPGGERENVSNEVAAFIFAKALKSDCCCAAYTEFINSPIRN